MYLEFKHHSISFCLGKVSYGPLDVNAILFLLSVCENIIFFYLINGFIIIVGQIWGNLISSEVFSQRADENFTVTADDLTKCGANFDPNIKVNNTNLDRPDIIKVDV